MRAIWDFNSGCNLNCLYCGAYDDVGKHASLSITDVSLIVNNLSGLVDEIDLYGGEPLLATHLEKKLRIISSAGITANITTNGQLSCSVLDELATAGISVGTIMVSLDGFADIHDVLRGRGSYERAVAFLNHAIRLREEGLLTCELGINAVVNKMNIDRIKDYLHEWCKLKIDQIVLSPIVNIGRVRQNGWLIPEDEQTIRLYENVFDLVAFAKEYNNVHIDIPNPLFSVYLTLRYGMENLIQPYSCEAALKTIYIVFSGKLRPCRESHDIICDLKKQSLKTCYNNFAPFLQRVKRFDYSMECDCAFSERCNVCCFFHERSKPSICKLLEKRIAVLFDLCAFQLDEKSCSYADKERDYYNILYFNTMQHVSYAPEGYALLKQIKNRALNSVELERKTGINRKDILFFMAQEISGGHVHLCKESRS